MPKKTRLQKLRNQTRQTESFPTAQAAVLSNDFLSGNPVLKKDMIKSILFAGGITAFEIALYVIYYLKLFERR